VDGEAFERGAVFDAAAIEAVDAMKRLKSTIERTIGKHAFNRAHVMHHDFRFI